MPARFIRKNPDGSLERFELREKHSPTQSTLTPVTPWTWDTQQFIPPTDNPGDPGTGPVDPDDPGTGESILSVLSTPILQLPTPFFAAHRGADYRFPENTMYAWDHVAPFPDIILDVDIQRTSNGTLICNHDSTVDRLSAPLTGSISGYTETTWRQVKINFPTAATPPWPSQPDVYGTTWKQLADKYGGKRNIAVEGKTAGASQAVIADIVARGIQNRCLFNSFSATDCRAAVAAGIPAAQAYSGIPDLATAQANGLWAVILYTNFATQAVLDEAETRGLKVIMLQTRTQASMNTWINAGVSGFATDYVFTLTGKTPPTDATVAANNLAITNAGNPSNPAVTRPLFGSCPPYPGDSTGNMAISKFGSGIALRRFLSAFPATLKKHADSGIDHVSFSVPNAEYVTTFAQGANDAAVRAMVNSIPLADRSKIVLEFVHEADEKVNRGDEGYTIPAFIAAKNRFYDLVKAIDPQIKICATHTGWLFDPDNPDENEDDWGTVKADILGLDLDGIHATTVSASGQVNYPDFTDELAVARAFVTRWASNGYKWIAIPEFGTSRDGKVPIPGTVPTQYRHLGVDTTGTQRAAWIKRHGDLWINEPDIMFVTFFDYEMSDGNELIPGGPEYAVWDTFIAQSIANQPNVDTPVTPPATVKFPYLGASAADNTQFNALDTLVGGRHRSRRTYGSTIPASYTGAAFFPDVAAGRHSYWSIKPNVATFPTDTAQKNALSAFLDTVPATHKLTIFAWHEPEDEIRAGTFTLSQWGATQNAIADIIHAKARPNLRFGVCWMGYWTFDTTSPYYAYDWKSVMDFTKVDFYGIDPYKWNPTDPSLEQQLTRANSGRGAAAGVLSTVERLANFGARRVGLMEWGCTEYQVTLAQKAQWITDGYNWMRRWNTTAGAPFQIETAIYFNNNLDVVTDPADPKYDLRPNWELHDAPLSAYQLIVNDASTTTTTTAPVTIGGAALSTAAPTYPTGSNIYPVNPERTTL